MMDVRRHPNIELLTYSEIEDISGYVGNFHARVRQRGRFVDEDECTACGDCAAVCPVMIPDEYQQGFSSRKAIYIPFPQAVPSAYVLDMENCLGNNPIACGKCLEACQKKCINYDMKDRVIELEVGCIIAATGMDVYDPAHLDEFGYRRFENVVTSLEFERLLSEGGPTEGRLVRPTDLERPKTIGFIQCVGSRSLKRGNPYCSNICCMNTIKDTLLLHDHYPEVQCTVFYMDIRAFGKGFEEMFMRSKKAGVRFVRGIPGEIRQDPGSRNLKLSVENASTGAMEEHDLDMVVLATGVVPSQGSEEVRKMLTLSKSPDGFLLESHPKLKPVDAPTKGVFYAGCSEAPKDIKESVTQASAAASKAGILLGRGEVRIEAIGSRLRKDACVMCGVCAKVCPYNAIVPPDKAEGRTPVIIEAACTGCGTCAAECRFDAIDMRHFSDRAIMAQIDALLAKKPEEKILVFACNWCSFAGGDGAGTARLQYPPTQRLIRTMCSGRVDEKFVLRGLEKGAAIVLVSGCHFSDCHYISAVQWTQKRVERLWDKLERWGIRPERVQLEWISAAEGQKFARVMKELEEMRAGVSREEIRETQKILRARKEKKKKAAKKKKARAVAK
jgi:heterodisulfide reductase subunit A